MKTAFIYLKSQKFNIIGFITLIILPFLAICLYLPKIPYMHYFFILVLFLIKILVQNDAALRKKLKPTVQSELTKELKRNPSGQEIFNRINFHIRSRDFSLLVTGVVILGISIVFNRL